jgi:YD repeat-containing protein
MSLVYAIEPNPSGGADLETTYAYNARNQLTGVTMPRGGVTQTRAFNFDLATGRLMSAANPENGTVSYTYNADGTLATKVDARNQKVEYVYDSYQRVTQVKRYIYRYGSQQEDACQRMTYSYDTNPLEPSYTQNGWGRLTAVSWGGSSCTGGVWSEMYRIRAERSGESQ